MSAAYLNTWAGFGTMFLGAIVFALVVAAPLYWLEKHKEMTDAFIRRHRAIGGISTVISVSALCAVIIPAANSSIPLSLRIASVIIVFIAFFASVLYWARMGNIPLKERRVEQLQNQAYAGILAIRKLSEMQIVPAPFYRKILLETQENGNFRIELLPHKTGEKETLDAA